MSLMFMPQIRALAVNVWREATRDRLILMLVGSGVLMMMVSLVFGQMAVGGQDRILQDMGYWIMGMWGLIAVIYLDPASSNMNCSERRYIWSSLAP